MRRTAVIYLRVSSIGQVNTDRDGEGFSIGAQRDACLRKAESLEADVLEVYVDAAESARKADRPQLQAMLDRLQDQRDVDYLIVHKVDRLARNRGDDVAITLAIRQAGAQLVSVTEIIDESPSGMLLHGIMSSIAEFYSQNLATEIIKGTSKKVERGGFPALAPIGYLNKQDFSGGNQFRWIEPDPERAEHVTWAFDAYRSGDYTLRQLTEALEERGLVTRSTAQRVSKPLSVRMVHNMLRNRIYVGNFIWKGVEYQGNHDALTSIETFAAVQGIMQSRRYSGEKPQEHPNYLKGTIFCARCGSQMQFSKNQGRRGGIYDYYVCGGRHERRNDCNLPYVSVNEVMDAIVDYYFTIQMDRKNVEAIYNAVLKDAKRRNQAAIRAAKRERKRILDLEVERRKLLQAHLAGAVPLDLLKEEQERINKALATAGAMLVNTEIHWEQLELNLGIALDMATRFGEMYKEASPQTRRHLNQAIFESICIDVDGRIVYARLAEPFDTLFDEQLIEWLRKEATNPAPSGVRGSRMVNLVEAMVSGSRVYGTRCLSISGTPLMRWFDGSGQVLRASCAHRRALGP